MGQEPGSLFLYGDYSAAARNVREAIYDGPFDVLGFEVQPVILEKIPRLADGDAVLETVQVEAGSLIVDVGGGLVNLGEGITYYPSGCNASECAETYTGDQPVAMEQLAARFKLKGGIQWSDGAKLTASDSQFSYEVAKSLYPRVRPDLINHTQSYLAVDGTIVEWRGVPGYRDVLYRTNFFDPLPEHAWGDKLLEELLSAEISNRSPIGWGPYVIDEWVSGDHISLHKNPLYFRSGEGLPVFDNLVFRFVPNGDEALSALRAGECDFIDETVALEDQIAGLLQLQADGYLTVAFASGTAWEHADFGIASLDQEKPGLFQIKEVRQAIAMCVDRQSIVNELFFGRSQVPDTYIPPLHPLYYPEATHYDFNPQAASELLESLGWVDVDNDPTTPRISQGVQDVPNGTPFEFTYLTTSDGEREKVANMFQASLAQCGIRVDIDLWDRDELFAPGPDGPIFGRRFDMAQFGWETSLEPPCFLFTSDEIPGPYPDFPKGWGGANASGYSNPEFDLACVNARFSLPDEKEHQEAHHQAQKIFSEDLPTIPLYLRQKLVIMRPDMCSVILDPSVGSSLWNIETFDYGEGCED